MSVSHDDKGALGPPSLRMRVAQVLLGALVAGTAAWIGIALSAAGDFLDLDAPRALGLVIACTLGAFGALRIRRGFLRVFLHVLAVLSVLFWAAGPDGWWAKPPAKPGDLLLRGEA